MHEDSVFYYRLHSPVILIELGHQRDIALGNEKPWRNHIHTVVRTPNGNDYGNDLLRQHHQQFDHTRSGTAIRTRVKTAGRKNVSDIRAAKAIARNL